MLGPVIAKPIPGKTKIPEPIIELILIVITENKPNLLSKLANFFLYFLNFEKSFDRKDSFRSNPFFSLIASAFFI